MVDKHHNRLIHSYNQYHMHNHKNVDSNHQETPHQLGKCHMDYIHCKVVVSGGMCHKDAGVCLFHGSIGVHMDNLESHCAVFGHDKLLLPYFGFLVGSRKYTLYRLLW